MGTPRWVLDGARHERAATARNWVTGLLAYCWAWLLYTLALSSLFGNVGTTGLAAVTMIQVGAASKSATRLISPVIAWVSFATLIVLRQLNLI